MVWAAWLAVTLSTVAVGKGGAVATAHPLASEAAAQVLRDGGNAADAAVAAAFALGVVEPQSSGIGGGGFAVIWSAREKVARVLDFRVVAPRAATADLYVRPGVPPRASLDGGLAVAVPGAVKGYAALAQRFGTRPLRALVEPAARIAERGFRLGPVYVERARARAACLREDGAAAREFLPRGGDALPTPGDRLVRRDLARTLRAIGRDPEAFYRGDLARAIVRAVRARGGILDLADLAAFRVRDRAPLEGRYRGHRILTMPPPSAGGAIVLGILGALEGEAPRAGGYRPPSYLHVLIEAEKRTFARRAEAFGDPDQVPGARAAAEEMATPEYGARLRESIAAESTAPASPRAATEKGDTSHISVIDAEGNAVTLTTTVNYLFGSCVLVPGTGILLNDEMDDFDRAPGVPNASGLVGTGPNAIAPGKIPLSSMSPTLVLDPDGRLRLVVGAAGGSRIPTAVAQAILHVIDDDMRLDDALGAPRIHDQSEPDRVEVEANGLDAATVRELEARGHVFRWVPRGGTLSGGANANAAGIDRAGLREAAADPRYEGAAVAAP